MNRVSTIYIDNQSFINYNFNISVEQFNITKLKISIMNGEVNLKKLITSMKPHLNDGEYVFCTLKKITIDLENIICFFKEAEGFTIVCAKAYADENGFAYHGIFAWITLQVHSALEAVGLTAAFSSALAKNQIPCNVIAGYYHDHLFVPKEKAAEAIKVLIHLSTSI